MSNLYLKLVANADNDSVTMIDADSVTEYAVLRDGFSIGEAVEQPMFSRTIDSAGTRVTGASIGSREFQFQVLITGADSSAVVSSFNSLVSFCAKIGESGGGVASYRSATGSSVTRFTVAHAAVRGGGDIADLESHSRLVVAVSLVCDPFTMGALYAVDDDFSVDTFGVDGVYNPDGADWLADAGAFSNMSISGGELAPAANYTTENRIIHTGTGHSFSDCEVAVRMISVSGDAYSDVGAIVKRIDDENYIRAKIFDDILVEVEGGVPEKTAQTVTMSYGNQSSSVTPPTAVNVEIDDIVIVAVSNYGYFWPLTLTPPGGQTWTEEVTISASSCSVNLSVWWHRVTADAASLTMPTIAGTGHKHANTMVVRGCLAAASPFDATPVENDTASSGTTVTTNAITTVTDDCLILAIFGARTSGNRTLSSPTITGCIDVAILEHNAYSAGTGQISTNGWVSGTAGAAGSHGGLSVTLDIAQYGYAGVTIALKPNSSSGEFVGVGIEIVQAGVVTLETTGTVPEITATANKDLELRARIEGSNVYAELYVGDSPVPGAPDAESSYLLSSSEAAIFGEEISGGVGLSWQPDTAAPRIDSFTVRPLTYAQHVFPDVLHLPGAWGGTTDALAAIEYTNAAGGSAPTRMLYAWWPVLWEQPNILTNGHFERDTSGWSVAAVAGLNAVAATSITRVTTDAYNGNACGQVVTPATDTSGVNFALYGKFKKGRTYTATCYARSEAHTTLVSARLGNSLTDVGDSGALALTTSWALHTVTWTPDADCDVAWFAIRIGAATATTFQIDNVQVYEGATAPTYTPGAYGPGVIDAANADPATMGSAWTITADADYLNGYGLQGSGALSTNGRAEFFIRPDLFPVDKHTNKEVDIAIFARLETIDTQLGVTVAASVVADSTYTDLDQQILTEFGSSGRSLPDHLSASLEFMPVYLGTVTCRADRLNAVRQKLRLDFTNSGSSTGGVGIDYLVLVPLRNVASSQRGAADGNVPAFIGKTTAMTKRVEHDLSATLLDVENSIDGRATRAGGLLGERIRLPVGGANLLVWPSDEQVDNPAPEFGMTETYTGTVSVEVQPMFHALGE